MITSKEKAGTVDAKANNDVIKSIEVYTARYKKKRMSTDELITDPLLPESSSANDISGNKERKLLMLRKA